MTREDLRGIRDKILLALELYIRDHNPITRTVPDDKSLSAYHGGVRDAINEARKQFAECEKSMFQEEEKSILKESYLRLSN